MEYFETKLTFNSEDLNSFFEEFNPLPGGGNLKCPLVIKNELCELVTDELMIAKCFDEKFVQINKVHLIIHKTF